MSRDTTKPVPSLYSELGGAPALRAVVEAFYERVLADEALRPFFAATDMPRLKAHQAAFLGSVLGAAAGHGGTDLRSAHAGRGIGDEHFDRVARHLQDALVSLGVRDEHVRTIATAAASLRGDVVAADRGMRP